MFPLGDLGSPEPGGFYTPPSKRLIPDVQLLEGTHALQSGHQTFTHPATTVLHWGTSVPEDSLGHVQGQVRLSQLGAGGVTGIQHGLRCCYTSYRTQASHTSEDGPAPNVNNADATGPCSTFNTAAVTRCWRPQQ